MADIDVPRPLPLVYIAGPYTHPDPVVNTRTAVVIGMGLYTTDVAYPVIPHLSHFIHYLLPQDIDFWYEFDLQMLGRCDAVLRLAGQSTGADREVAYAERLGLPVFTVAAEVAKWATFWKPGEAVA